MCVADDPEYGSDRFITYPLFLSRYWSHFSQKHLGMCVIYPASCVSNLEPDPALVFGEILGVIKGSEKAIGTQNRSLELGAYLSSGHQGMLSHAREAVYDLFNLYTKKKRQRQEYDAADR